MIQEKFAGNINVSQEFNVPVEQVYKAWTNEQLLKEWWHPFQKDLANIRNELKDGGLVEYDFGGDQKCNVRGEYKEVVENRRLVYTWNWDLVHDEMKNGDYLLTIDFESTGNGSKITVHQEGFIDDDSTLPHKQGWKRGLESLRAFLENKSE